MRTVLACAFICFTAHPAAAGQCSPDDVKAANHWSMPCFKEVEPVAAPSARPATKLATGVPTWLKAMTRHERLIAKALQIGDREEVQRQSYEVRSRIAEIDAWPKDDAWTYARIYCTTRAQELANFADDKLKGSSRGEIAAEDSMRAYRDGTKECAKGLAKLK